MFNKKRLLLLLLSMILLLSIFLTGCFQEGKEKEGMKLLDEMLEEGKDAFEEDEPEPEPKPEEEKPEEEEKPPEKVGFIFTDEEIAEIVAAWPSPSVTPDSFGPVFAIHLDQDVKNGTSYGSYEWRSDLPVAQLLDNYGMPIFGMTPGETYYQGVWHDVTNDSGDSVEVGLNVIEREAHNVVYVNLMPPGQYDVVGVVQQRLWPYEFLIDEIGDMPPMYWGIGHYPQTQGVELWRTYETPEGGAMTWFNSFMTREEGRSGYDYQPGDGYIAPRISGGYDIDGDGIDDVNFNVSAYDSANMLNVSFSHKVSDQLDLLR